METKAVEAGRGRARAVMGLAGLGVAAVLVTAFARLSPPSTAFDIHSEYVKFLSGKDTVTAYIAYPERPQPAPAVIVIPGEGWVRRHRAGPVVTPRRHAGHARFGTQAHPNTES